MSAPSTRSLGSSVVELDEPDDLDVYLDEQLADPAFAAAYEDAAARSRLVADLIGCRKAHGLRQRDIAEHMGVRQSVVSQFENGAGEAHLSTLQRYARALGMRLTTRIEMPADQSWAEHVNRRAYARPTTSIRAAPVRESSTAGLHDWVDAARGDLRVA